MSDKEKTLRAEVALLEGEVAGLRLWIRGLVERVGRLENLADRAAKPPERGGSDG